MLAAGGAAGAKQFRDFTYEDNGWEYDGYGVTITKYTGKGGSVTIPAAIRGKPVIAIGRVRGDPSLPIDGAVFAGAGADITSVAIPDSVEDITSEAFLGCPGLTSITAAADNPQYSSQDGVLFDKDAQVLLAYPGGKKGAYSIPDSVTSIRGEAFANCTGLTSVTIPDSVTNIWERAFSTCARLTSVTIENGVKSMGVGAFYQCYKLTSVTIGNGVTSIGDATFALCSLASIAILDSITSIGKHAFLFCKLTSVTIAPVKGRKWSNDAFEGNSGMNIASQSALRKAGIRGF